MAKFRMKLSLSSIIVISYIEKLSKRVKETERSMGSNDSRQEFMPTSQRHINSRRMCGAIQKMRIILHPSFSWANLQDASSHKIIPFFMQSHCKLKLSLESKVQPTPFSTPMHSNLVNVLHFLFLVCKF